MKTIKLYTIDELKQEAKQKAIEKIRKNLHVDGKQFEVQR